MRRSQCNSTSIHPSPVAGPRLSTLRDTVQVQFEDGRVFEAPTGTPLSEFVHAAFDSGSVPVVAGLADNKLRELFCPVLRDLQVKPVDISDSDGMRIYRRSLTFLLVAAMNRVFPDARVHVNHSLTFGGLFCHVEGRRPLSKSEVRLVERRMNELVRADLPIERRRVPVSEAIALFEAKGQDDMVRLLRHRQKEDVVLYHLGDTAAHLGYMVPSTRYLRYFGLQHYSDGFLLRYPRHEEPTCLNPVVEYPKLVSVFREYNHWLHVLGIDDVGALNNAIAAGRADEVALVSEALHQQKISEIAIEIGKRRPAIRLVLIAGPSASGKTTFSKRLAIQLLANELRPVAIAMDNYFVDREQTPIDEQGKYDFEHLDALDLDLLNSQLAQLLDGREVQLPRYDFPSGRRVVGQPLRLSKEHVILLEGIHGLNPSLLTGVPADLCYRVYVSALTQLNFGHLDRVPTTDTRLIRRIVRDARERGYSAKVTLRRWDSVRRGEKRWIFPYQEHADVMFNSALVHELSVLKPLAEPLIYQIEDSMPERIEARRLLALLRWFLPLDLAAVPSNSILREFVGGSSLQEFTLWRDRMRAPISQMGS